MKSILLCGCGNIGYRHLQAMVQVPGPVRIDIVEPSLAAHPRIAALIAGDTGGHQILLQDSIPAAADQAARGHYDVVVVATSAAARRAALEAVLARHSVGVMILEKVLFQTLADLDAVGAALQAAGVAAYVNCGRRYAPGYQAGRAQWADGRPLHITVNGSAYGMASNGIHLIDLAEYLNGADLVALEASGLLPGAEPTKREGCVEVFGTLKGRLSNGAMLDIICHNTPDLAFDLRIKGTGIDLRINELGREITADGVTTPFALRNVSECHDIYREALSEGRCGLTPYADSARQHRYFLTALLHHLGLAETQICPIS
jgi:predicted dehydrogenase